MKTAFSSHFLSSPCSWIPGSVPTSCCSSLKGGLQRREPAAILAAKTCPGVDRRLEEAPGIFLRPGGSPESPGTAPLPKPTSCNVAGAQAQGEIHAASFFLAGGPSFGDGSVGGKGASPHSAHQSMSQGISLPGEGMVVVQLLSRVQLFAGAAVRSSPPTLMLPEA